MQSLTIRHVLLTGTAGALVVLGAACNDDDGVVDNNPTEQYSATLSPMNNSGASGTATFDIRNGQFVATLNTTGVTADIVHAQHIHFANACPTAAADANGDGLVDVVEGLPTYGKILVPLDATLATQDDMGDFPMANADGSYTYKDSTSLDAMVTDLRTSQSDTSVVAQLGASEELNMGTRAVVVHGVADSTTLPSTVQTLPGLTPQQTLPVLCGPVSRVSP